MKSLVLCLGKPAPCGRADLEEGAGRALDHRPRYKSQKQASKYGINVSQPALAGGRVDPATLCIILVWMPTWW